MRMNEETELQQDFIYFFPLLLIYSPELAQFDRAKVIGQVKRKLLACVLI